LSACVPHEGVSRYNDMAHILHGYSVIDWVQSFHTPFLDTFFLWMTHLGSGTFYIGAIALLYLCIDKKFAVRIFYLFILGILLNGFIKEFFGTARPDPERVRVVNGYRADGGSFPSGHSQGVIAFWGYCFTRFKNPFCIIAGSFLICVVPLSRLYLGVHYPVDIIGGLLIGLLTVGIFAAWFKLSERIRWREYLIPALACIIAAPLVYFYFFPSRENSQMMGTMIGFGAGSFLERRYIRFDEKGGSLLFQLGKMMFGIAGALLLMFCFSLIPAQPLVRKLVAYAAGSFWIGYGVPYFVQRARAVSGAGGTAHAG